MPFNSTSIGLAPSKAITGAVVSTTFTVLVAVPVLPLSSFALYVMVYVPTVAVSTVPVIVTVSPPSDVAPGPV